MSEELILENFLPYRLSILSNTVSSTIARIYDKRFSLSIPEWRVIAILGRFPGLSAVEVADLFLNSGVVVSARGRADDANFSMRARQGDLLEGARMAVLVNSGSASSSEIVAGALKDLDRATIVGSQTYGKGSVQTVIPLSGGRALKLTTSRYFTPSGESIHQRGIMPDIVVISDDEESVALTSLTSAVEADALMKDNQVRTALATIKRRPILHSRAK